MSKASINFELLARELNNYITAFVPKWISGGEQKGSEYKAASIYGGKGDSFSINLHTGKWADFANPDHSGGDLISLYAKIHNLKNSQAAATLAEMIGFQETHPENVSERLPNLISARFGKPTKYWVYRNKRGFSTGLVVRYDPPNEKKQFSQWHFSKTDQKWVAKSHPDPRPLYKLDQLDRNPSLTIVLCEGEKAADAAQELFGDNYIATCWIGGSNAIKKADFSPLYNRNVILWPDNDEAGIKAMTDISKQIVLQVSTLSTIQPLETDEPKSDAADLLDTAPDVQQFSDYLQKRLKIIKAMPTEKNAKSGLIVSPDSDAPRSVGVALPYSEDEQELDLLTDAQIMVKWQDMGLMMKSQTKVYQNEANILRILNYSDKTQGTVYYDEFHKCYMSTYSTTQPERFSDITFTRFKLLLQQQYGFGDISTASVKESLRYYASQTIKNSLAEYLLGLKWDGEPRINDFMHVIYGTESNEYNTAVSRIFWLSLIARILDVGCKADIMVILEGDQGIQKSASLEEIGSLNGQNFYSVAGKRLDNKDFYIGLTGKYIVEMGEINVLIKNSDEDIKEMLSTRIDDFRIPYASESTPNPRTNIFVGTTNQENYLRDETGARRFLPVKCKTVNMDVLKETKLQLFAEAVHRKLAGEDHWVFPKELAKEQTDLRSEMDDIWTDPVMRYVNENKYRYIKVYNIATDALGLSNDRQDQRTLNRISKILKKRGFVKIQIREGNDRFWVYEDTAQTSGKKSWIDRPFLMS